MSLYRIARAAQEDLEEIWCYIGGFDMRAADRWLEAIERQLEALAIRPIFGQARPDLARALRFLPVGNYLIFYRPLDHGVEIARVIHGTRDYGPEYF